jgi:hypothetical protein
VWTFDDPGGKQAASDTSSDRALALGDLLDRLRRADRWLRVFGAKRHRYWVGARLSEDQLERFEVAHGVKLPADYRAFLSTVGNGGAGPYYGLGRLQAFGRDLSKPFPFAVATNELPEEAFESFADRDEYPGILEFCHMGCDIYAYLVVNGPTYGTIWEGREDFFPTGESFSGWYRAWAERSLRRVENLGVARRLRRGMTKTEVVDATGASDWQERVTPHVHVFESSVVPAQVVLSAEGIVVKVNPWVDL